MEDASHLAAAAMKKAEEVAAQLATFMAVSVERDANLQKTLTSIQNTLKWVGTTAVSAILVLGIWGVQQMITSSAAKDQLRDSQFHMLESRMSSMAAAARTGTVVVNPAPAASPSQAPAAQPTPYAGVEPGQVAQ